MIENYVTSEWQTTKELLRQYRKGGLPISARTLRRIIENYNEDYFNSEKENMIIYSDKGYKMTSNDKEIEKCMNAHLKLAIVHFKKYHRIKRAKGFKSECKLIVNGEEL